MKSVTIFRLVHPRKYITFVETASHGTVKVVFEPVPCYGRVENSMFSTNDEEVIAALKAHREFGSIFHVQEEGREEVQCTVASAALSKNDDPRNYLTDPENAIEEATVTSAQMANNYLQRKFGQVFEATKVHDMKIEAARKYNLIFVNW